MLLEHPIGKICLTFSPVSRMAHFTPLSIQDVMLPFAMSRVPLSVLLRGQIFVITAVVTAFNKWPFAFLFHCTGIFCVNKSVCFAVCMSCRS